MVHAVTQQLARNSRTSTLRLTQTRPCSLFPGLVQAGKLRRSRPVLGKLDSSSRDPPNANHDGDLPPGCAIVDRNPLRVALSTTAGGRSDADPTKTSQGTAKPLPAATAPAEQASDCDGVVATDRNPPTVSTTSSQQHAAVASGGTTSEIRGGLGRILDVTNTQGVAPAITRPTVRYTPGPTFRKARGRKRKALLDPSEVTEGSIIGGKVLEALLKDTTLQQVRYRMILS